MFYHSNEDGALGRSGAGICLHIQASRVPPRGLGHSLSIHTLVDHTVLKNICFVPGGGVPQHSVNSGPALLLATNDTPKSGSQLQVGTEHIALELIPQLSCAEDPPPGRGGSQVWDKRLQALVSTQVYRH